MKTNKLKELRGQKSITDVAEAINASPDVYIAYERGEREPKEVVKQSIAKFFNVQVSDIF